jgi:hypothetical protein
VQGHQSFVSRPPLPEGGPIQADPVSATSEAPEADKSQDKDDAKISLEEDSLNTSPPPAYSEEPSLDKKRKRVEELLSSSTSAPKDAAGEPSPRILLKLKFLMLWTRESCLFKYLSFIHFLSFDLCKVFVFCSISSDDEDPKRDTATASLVGTLVANEMPSQEAIVVVKSPEAPVKKGTSSRASKRLKKAATASASLDTHRPVGSPDDVSTALYGLLFLLLKFFFSCLPLTDSDEKIHFFGH